VFDTVHVFLNFPKLALRAVTAVWLFTAEQSFAQWHSNIMLSRKRKAWTVSDKVMEKLRELLHTVDDNDGLNRKRARLPNDESLDAALYKWFVQQQQNGIPLSGTILCAQSEKSDKQLNGQSSLFKASSGCLWRFLKRHESPPRL